jgi:hypothetical protein
MEILKIIQRIMNQSGRNWPVNQKWKGKLKKLCLVSKELPELPERKTRRNWKPKVAPPQPTRTHRIKATSPRIYPVLGVIRLTS